MSEDTKADGHGTGHIVQSLLVNVAIAAIKTAAALITGSGAMLAEALHSFSDTGNQILLLVGVRQAKRSPDALHPFGYGRALYFWSFLVALMLFLGGGVFSIYEGLHKWSHPEPVEKPLIGLSVLLISFVLEGSAVLSNLRDMKKRRREKSLWNYLRDTKDSDLVVVFGENAAAVFGLALAGIGLGLAWQTGDGRWDAAGCVGVGVVLVLVAAFLAIEIHSLLLGESADSELIKGVERHAHLFPDVLRVIHVRAVQQGPGEVLVAVKLAFAPELGSVALCTLINDFEASLRGEYPEVRYCFVEPGFLDMP